MQKIEVSTKSIIFAIFFVVLLRFLGQIKDILLLVFVSFIFMAALRPIVEKLHHLKIPKILGIILCYIFFLGILGSAVASVIPPIVEQTALLFKKLPQLLSEEIVFWNLKVEPGIFNDQLAGIPKNIFQVLVSAFSNVVSLFIFLVFTAYLTLERENFHSHLVGFFGSEKGRKIERVLTSIERKIGQWVRGEIILMVVIGIMSYIGLVFLGIPYAAPLALVAGILEIVPNLGPIASAIPAVLIGFSNSYVMGFAVAALYTLIQQLENNLIVPKVMQEVVGLRPVITLLSLMIGFRLFGIVGAILSIPMVLALQIVFLELLDNQYSSKKKAVKTE